MFGLIYITAIAIFVSCTRLLQVRTDVLYLSIFFFSLSILTNDQASFVIEIISTCLSIDKLSLINLLGKRTRGRDRQTDRKRIRIFLTWIKLPSFQIWNRHLYRNNSNQESCLLRASLVISLSHSLFLHLL